MISYGFSSRLEANSYLTWRDQSLKSLWILNPMFWFSLDLRSCLRPGMELLRKYTYYADSMLVNMTTSRGLIYSIWKVCNTICKSMTLFLVRFHRDFVHLSSLLCSFAIFLFLFYHSFCIVQVPTRYTSSPTLIAYLFAGISSDEQSKWSFHCCSSRALRSLPWDRDLPMLQSSPTTHPPPILQHCLITLLLQSAAMSRRAVPRMVLA